MVSAIIMCFVIVRHVHIGEFLVQIKMRDDEFHITLLYLPSLKILTR